jgi:predicted transcriptional regulator
MMVTMSEAITIRHSTDRDRARVLRLAQLDDRPAPVGDALLAEVDGQLWAAVGIDDGSAVADPFRPTHDMVWLLQVRAEQERVSRAAERVGRAAA